MNSINRGSFRVALAVILLGAISFSVFSFLQLPAKAASAGDVIINELMYKPASNLDDDEFLELYNKTASPIDISNWCFTEGITLATANPAFPTCFEAGTTIAANGYLVVSPNPTQTNTTYGVVATASYAGSALSNGGETVTLVDDGTNVINSITYDDIAPWPTSPDGDGPSLELKNPNLDNTDGNNWGASIGGPTPGAENSLVSINLPSITNVNDPNDITDADTVNITATVSGQDSVNLVYKVMFGADVTVPMLDDGNNGDGAVSDGVYGATIPAQTAGKLVRFKVEATNTDGTASSPSVDDSINYHGYMVQDPSVTSNAPIINWFIDDSDYADMLANHRHDNAYIPSVVVYGNDVYDNSRVRVRGDLARFEEKASYKFKLPSGNTIRPIGAVLPIAEFNLKATVKHSNLAAMVSYWWAYEQAGFDVPDVLPSRLQRNGQFEGAYLYIDKYDKEWQEANGYDDGVIYKPGEDAVASDEDGSEWVAFRDEITALDRRDPAKKNYFLDNLDMPTLFNYMAVSSSIGLNDTSDQHNSLIHVNRDTSRWRYIPWDLDGAGVSKTNLSPYDYDQDGDLDIIFLQGTVQQNPELRVLFLRRLRTLIDKFYEGSYSLNAKFEEVSDIQLADTNLDLNKWPNANNWGSNTTTFQRPSDSAWRLNTKYNFLRHKKNFAGYQRIPGGLPPSQTDQERQQVSINQAVYDANPANEYIKLDNGANTPVDISGWRIEGIDYTIPAGAVIPANGSIYILRADKDYRASHPSVLVAGQYSTGLNSGGGSLTLKTDSNLEIDSYAY